VRLKAVFPERRARQVRGIPLAKLKDDAGRAQSVRWFNGAEFMGEVSARDFLRRLNAMPEGCEVVIMARTSRSQRSFPVDTGCDPQQDGTLFLTTSYLY
jgi:hypothetical protein